MTIADILKGKDKVRREEHDRLVHLNHIQQAGHAAKQNPVVNENKLSQAISQGMADERDPTAALIRDELHQGVLPPGADGAPIDEKLLALNIRIQAQREEKVEQLELEKAAIESEIASEKRAIRMTGAAIAEADRCEPGEAK